MKSIVVVGSLNLDLVLHADRIPLSGETITGYGYNESLGGKGANQAIAAAKLGAQVTMVGCVGSDTYGKSLRFGMSQSGVDLSAVSTEEGPSGLAIITHAHSGANTIVVIPGANQALDEDALRQYTDIIRNASIVLLQLEIPMPSVVLAARLAHEAGVPVILDPAPARDLPKELIASTTWITPNETEAATLLHSTAQIEPHEAAERLVDGGATNVALKLGERGVFLMGRDCPEGKMIASPHVTAIDTIAAGDCFNGAFATQLITGATPAEAARYACAAASISVTRNGAQDSMPTAQEVEAALKRTASATLS